MRDLFRFHEDSRLLHQAGPQQFPQHRQDSASADPCRLLVPDRCKLYPILCKCDIFNGAFIRPHPGADIHALQRRTCRAGTAQQPPPAGKDDLPIGANIDEQHIPLRPGKLADMSPCHDVRSDIGGYLRQAVEPCMFTGFQTDLSCQKGLRLQKCRLIGRPSNGSCVHSQKHMHHGAVGAHINLPDNFRGNIRLPAHLGDHGI